MDIKDLMKLKPQIESTVSEEGLSIGEREFAWIYEPGYPIKLLEEIDSLEVCFAGGPEYGVGFLRPRNTNAVAMIHNHPSGNVSSNYFDVNSFLACLPYNPRLRYGLIASAKGANVSGYYIMEYLGRRSEIKNMRKRISEMYKNNCILRHKEIDEHPEQFNLRIGDDIFTKDEIITMALKMMSESKIRGEPVHLPGYKFEDWKFVKDIDYLASYSIKEFR